MALKQNEEQALALIMQACKLMGWVMAFNDPADNGNINHLVIGEEAVVQSLVSEGAEHYSIVIPPK
jgi:Tfp pilus assembly protein PilW